MRVSISKFEAMVLCWKMVDCSIRVGGELLHKMKEFIYLGVLLMSEDKTDWWEISSNIDTVLSICVLHLI